MLQFILQFIKLNLQQMIFNTVDCYVSDGT